MRASVAIVVVLHINAGREAEFERFETAVAKIMRRHGGMLERRIAVEPGGDASQPHEVHIVTFPERAALDRYRADPEFKELAALRAEAIRETIFWFGADRTPFESTSA